MNAILSNYELRDKILFLQIMADLSHNRHFFFVHYLNPILSFSEQSDNLMMFFDFNLKVHATLSRHYLKKFIQQS